MRFTYMILILAGLALTAPLQAAPFTAEQEKAIEKLIADYFVANPEKLGDALDNMQAHYRDIEAQRMAQTL